MANLIQLRRMVRNRIGVSSTDQFFRDDLIDDALNAAIVTFESERNWDWQLRVATITAPDSTGVLPLPTDWKATRDLRSTDELAYVRPYELLDYRDEVGTPQVYSHIGNTLEVRPLAAVGTTFKISYYRNATLLTEDADEPDLPDNGYPAIVAKAAHLCSIREDDRPSAETHLVEYMQWLDRMNKTGNNTTRTVGRRIRPGNWT